jgi:uncharacterized protein with FMN-binding domain
LKNLTNLSIGLFMICTIIAMLSCSPATTIGNKVESDRLTDGVFDGEYAHGPNKAKVRVTIENQRITNVEILMHDQMRGKKAEPVIPARIVEMQSTAVDVVTGATNSSRVIMNAAQKAIEQSYAKAASR